MVKKTTRAPRSASILTALLTGVGISIAVTVLGAAIFTWAIMSKWIGENNTEIAAWITVFAASAFGAYAASYTAGKKRLLVCLLNAGVYFLILLTVTAMFFDGQYSGIFINMIIILIASEAVTLLTMRTGNNKNHKHLKKAYR